MVNVFLKKRKKEKKKIIIPQESFGYKMFGNYFSNTFLWLNHNLIGFNAANHLEIQRT